MAPRSALPYMRCILLQLNYKAHLRGWIYKAHLGVNLHNAPRGWIYKHTSGLEGRVFIKGARVVVHEQGSRMVSFNHNRLFVLVFHFCIHALQNFFLAQSLVRDIFSQVIKKNIKVNSYFNDSYINLSLFLTHVTTTIVCFNLMVFG